MCASIWMEDIDGKEIASADSLFASSVTEKVVSGEDSFNMYGL